MVKYQEKIIYGLMGLSFSCYLFLRLEIETSYLTDIKISGTYFVKKNIGHRLLAYNLLLKKTVTDDVGFLFIIGFEKGIW
jgi:hypothetical protein